MTTITTINTAFVTANIPHDIATIEGEKMVFFPSVMECTALIVPTGEGATITFEEGFGYNGVVHQFVTIDRLVDILCDILAE